MSNWVRVEPFVNENTMGVHQREIQKDKGGVDLSPAPGHNNNGVVASFIRKIGSKLLSGQLNFSSMQRPAMITNPYSHLEIIAYEFSILMPYLMYAFSLSDPILRFKTVVAGVIGNLPLNILQSAGKCPLNPLLGETYSVF